MENCGDFLYWLGPDISNHILMCLKDLSDLVRVGCVSRSWRQFVIANGFCKNLCTEMFPETQCFTDVIDVRHSSKPIEVRSNVSMEWENLERDHRAYVCLARALMSSVTKKACNLAPVGASSTDNFPAESIENTLEASDRLVHLEHDIPSYWSSRGQSNPEVSETLTYRLCYDLFVVDEIYIRPFQAYFQDGHPIYSAKAVRFRMGYIRSPMDIRSHFMDGSWNGQDIDDDNYIWTYVSPEFPMVQENLLQTFKLPRSVLCIGGILQIELLGRVQRQEMDDLYYICVCHVQVSGWSLSPAFDVNIVDNPGICILKYFS